MAAASRCHCTARGSARQRMTGLLSARLGSHRSTVRPFRHTGMANIKVFQTPRWFSKHDPDPPELSRGQRSCNREPSRKKHRTSQLQNMSCCLPYALDPDFPPSRPNVAQKQSKPTTKCHHKSVDPPNCQRPFARRQPCQKWRTPTSIEMAFDLLYGLKCPG